MMLGDQHVLSTLFKLMFWGAGSQDETNKVEPREILGSNAAKFQLDEIGFANIPLSPLDFVKSSAKLHPLD